MNRVFETIESQVRNGRWARPQATMNANGNLKINRVAFELLGEPDKVEVLFDRASKTIALRAADHRDYKAHRCVAHGKHGRHGGRLIRIHGIIELLEGDIYTCVRFRNVHLDTNNRLILELTSAVPAFHGKRIGVYEQWLAKRRDHTNQKARENYAKRSSKKPAEQPDLSYTAPPETRGHGF